MNNLTITAFWTRKFIKYGSITLVCFLIFQATFNYVMKVIDENRPKPPAPPTLVFGKLPKAKFPEKKGLPTITYKLETINGTLPQFATIAKVFVSIQPNASLLSFDKAKETARLLGFSSDPLALSPRSYRFATTTPPITTMDIDIITSNFKYHYDYTTDQSILNEKKLPTGEQAISEAKSILGNAGTLPEDIGKGNGNISYYKYNPPNLAPVSSIWDADFMKVWLLRGSIDQMPFYQENFSESSINVLFSGARSTKNRILEINYTYNIIDSQTFGTYPLKTTNTAWQELLGNQGYVATLGNNPDGKITIRKASLAYYDNSEGQNFIQPIFVFEGDNGFAAYVPAIDSKYID